MKTKSTINGWQDFIELCIASWVFISPFALGFFSNVNASLSCMFIGGLVICMSIFGIAKEAPGLEWASLCLAVLLIASPWLFSYAHISAAVFSAVVSGVLIIVFATLAMMHEYSDAQNASNQKPASAS